MKFDFKLHLNRLQHAKCAKALFERQSSSPIEFPRASFLLRAHDALHHPASERGEVNVRKTSISTPEANKNPFQHLNQRPSKTSNISWLGLAPIKLQPKVVLLLPRNLFTQEADGPRHSIKHHGMSPFCTLCDPDINMTQTCRHQQSSCLCLCPSEMDILALGLFIQ